MTTDIVPVTQAARDAAADHVANSIGMGDVADRIRLGDFDHHETVQAFARLQARLASTQEPEQRGEEHICGAVMPDRLWLVDMGSGDVSWSGERNPDGEEPLEAVEYVRAAALQTPASPFPREEVAREAAFLCARVRELEQCEASMEMADDLYGHVLPSVARLESLLQRSGEQ